MTTHARRILLLFAIYVVTAELGLQLDAVSGFATLVWLPTGIALAALVLFGRRLWPAIAVGAFIVNLIAGAPVAVAVGIAAGNTFEALVGAWLLALLRFDPAVSRLRDVVVLTLAAAVASTVLSASIGTASLWIGGVIDASAVTSTWRAWWIGDALGDLIVAPVLLVWYAGRQGLPRRIVEGAAVVALTALTALYVFGTIVPPYFVFPMLIWAAVRFRQLGAVTGTFVVWVVAIVVTVVGFGSDHLSASLLPLQVFMAVVALATLCLGAVVCERDAAIRARDEFMAVASHELRTPLAALGLQITNLRELATTHDLPEDKLVAKLDVLERQGDRLSTLIDRLLDVSRIMAGRFEISAEPLDVTDTVRDVVGRLREQAAKAGCELVMELGETPPMVADRMRLEQVVTNLLANALKFGRGQPITVELTAPADDIVLRVRDQGVGIARDDHARVFERFERARAHRPSGGLGLGLWIVRRIVLAMGGSITLDSEPGSGAEFTVTLPRHPAPG